MNQRATTIAAFATAVFASTTSAVPVFFVNPEGTDRHIVHTFPASGSFEFIDVSKPARQQPPPGSDPLPGSAFSWSYVLDELGNPVGGPLGDPWKANLLPQGVPTPGFLRDGSHPAILQFGAAIGSGPLFGGASFERLSSLLPGDATGFFGLRFAIWNEAGTNFTTHFGWMQVDWLGEGLTGGVDLDILAWGYETTPDTPIAAGAVPAPGGAAVLALAGVFAARRGRRG